MKISQTTTNDGIFQDIDFICGTDSTSYPLTDKARNATRHYQKAIIDVLKACGKHQGTSDLTSTDTLVNGTQTYTLPADFLGLEAVEVKDAAGNWVRLRQIDKFELLRTITDHRDTPGMPIEYDVSGGNVTLYPAPATGSVTMSNGIKYHYQGEVATFASTDTSPEPAIPEPFHRIVSVGASCDYLLTNATTDKYDRWRQEYEQLRTEMRNYLNSRNQDLPNRIRPAHRTSHYE